MPQAMIGAYLERLPARLAEWQLMGATIASIPHMEEDNRSNVLDRWRDEADAGGPVPVATPAVLAFMGIAVEFVRQ